MWSLADRWILCCPHVCLTWIFGHAQFQLFTCAHLAGDQSKGVLAEVGVLGEESHELVSARLKQREPEQPCEEDPHLARHKPEPGEMLFPNLLQLSDQVVTVGFVGNSPSSPSVPSSDCLPSSGTQQGKTSQGISSSHDLRPSSPTTTSPQAEEVIAHLDLSQKIISCSSPGGRTPSSGVDKPGEQVSQGGQLAWRPCRGEQAGGGGEQQHHHLHLH